MDKIRDVQKYLKAHQIDGWLIYDFRRTNDLVQGFLNLPADSFLTRRFFYWVPAQGEPVKILHAIEPHALAHLPGETRIYLKWQDLESLLKELLKGKRRVAMEYALRNPYVSKVDAGTVDVVRQCGVEVVSSAPFLQHYSCILDDEQIELQKEAAHVLDRAVGKAWDFIANRLKNKQRVTEYDVQQHILEEFRLHKCVSEGEPIVGVNAHSADPHYIPKKESALAIKQGDFILIDLWCKKEHPKAVYGDICRVGVASSKPTARQQAIFTLVRKAQKTATDFIAERLKRGEEVKGFEADQAARKVIEEAGYGAYFTHRTGHNIYTQDHGPGAHLDSLETFDERPLIPRTCFSIEPGVYLPGEFGVRLEYDVFIEPSGKLSIRGGIQDELVTLS